MGHCYNTSIISAPIDQVWATISDFHNMDYATGVITSVDKVGAPGGREVGAKRILNGAFHETLQSLDADGFAFTYSIDDGPAPVGKDSVKDYLGSVRLIPVTDDNTTLIEWSSSYESVNDNAIGDFCNPIYRALLQALKQHFAD